MIFEDWFQENTKMTDEKFYARLRKYKDDWFEKCDAVQANTKMTDMKVWCPIQETTKFEQFNKTPKRQIWKVWCPDEKKFQNDWYERLHA